ncbi:hypothetical protein HPB48_003453 [Haemaphysalis longicornis]|uniref:CCHC-type domain-containing protein n=1 Tax=Haemaphysalis longicornis TaxID=44386 RepID=A0A9J6G1F5_HAELO|nr:hypothetical protein HPB48_003453 [Haemaphysalis longicornis]
MAIATVANLPVGAVNVKMRIDGDQNVLVMSTPSETTAMTLSNIKRLTIDGKSYEVASYAPSPDNSCKGVIHNIDLDTTPDTVLKRIEDPGYEVLTCRRLGNTETMVITFCGKRVPCYVNYSGIPVRCYVYKRSVPYCRKCNETGHREDVCPQPSTTPRCGECGLAITTAQHECHPQCILCGGSHTTADKSFTKRYLPPVNRQKPQRQQQQSSRQTRSPSPELRGGSSHFRHSRSSTRRSASQGRSISKRRSGSRLKTSSRKRTPSRDRIPSAGRSTSGGRKSKPASYTLPQVSWAQVTSPKALHAAVTPELARERAYSARVTEENITLKKELANMRAELLALRSEIRKADTTLHEPDAQSPPLVKRKREEKNLPTTSPDPSHQQATVTPSDQQGLLPAPYATVQEVIDMNSRTVQAVEAATQQAAAIPGDPQGPLPAAYATVQDVKDMEIRTIQALQATIEQAIQRSLQQHLPVLQQDIATQQQNFAGYIEERFARLEERLFALEDRHLRRLQKATTAEPTDLHMHQELPPDYDEDDCSPTDA